MKKLIQKKWVLSFIAFFFIFLSSASAANYVVSGADQAEFYGTYVETARWNDRPLYIFINHGNPYAIGFEMGSWKIGLWMGISIGGFYEARSTDATPPLTGWGGGEESMLTVMLEGKSLSYSTSLFIEHLNNVGSIANSMVISYNGYGGDAFTGETNEDYIASNKVTVSNVPAGLTASVIKTAGNQLTFSLTGNAISHKRTDRIDNIALRFQDAAFVQTNAANVSNYVKSNIGIQYIIFSGGNGTSENPHQIATLADLRFLSENTDYSGENLYFIQTADIDATETIIWNVGNHDGDAGTAVVAMGFSPIKANYGGSYDGQGHTISNLYINRPATDYVGLFGSLSSTVSNIGLTNVFIVGHDNVGGLAGAASGPVSNCFTTGSVKGYSMVGGLVGMNYANISTSYSNVNAEGNNAIGGLIGKNLQVNISNSYTTGSVKGNENLAGFIGYVGGYGTIDKCYAVGVVTGNIGSINVGGFIGVNDIRQPITITNCYWDSQTSGQTTSAAGGTAKVTLEMKTQATYTDWDFTTTTPIWKINSANNSGYPYLTWQIIPIATNSNSSALNLSGTSNIEIAAGVTLTLDANETVNRLILAPTAKLSLGTNTLNAPNGVVLESSVDGTATILGDNAVSNATVQQYVTAGRNWYISSPLSGAGYADLSRGVSVVEWNEASKNWDTKSSGTLTRGKGYIQLADAVQTGSTGTLSFEGTTNAGNIDVAVTRTESGNGPGFNLVGNPYPSYLNWSGFIAEATNANISRTYWYRTKNTIGGYTFVTYNGVGGTYVTSNGTANTSISGKIPPMQGFWIRVNSGTASTTARFTNAMREHRDGDQNIFKAPKLDERACLRLQLINGAKSDETMIYFDENAANQHDDYDSPKMMNNSDVDPDLYTKAGSERLVINGLKSVIDNMELPLGFNLNAPANLKIKAGELANFKTGTRIYLLDKAEKTQTELYPETEYSFITKTATTNNENRFSLLFRAPGISTDVDNLGTQTVNVFVDATNQLIVAAPLNSSYAIYNTVGQQIENGILDYKLQTINCKLNSGIYVVKVGNQTTRVIIK